MIRRTSQAVLHEGLVLLECREVGLLDELSLIPEFQAATVRLFPPRFALLDPAGLDGLLPLLRQRGYPPQLID
jgi:hypothetical protein